MDIKNGGENSDQNGFAKRWAVRWYWNKWRNPK